MRLILAFAIFFLLIFPSCCHKKGCIEGIDNEVQFVGFNIAEGDTILMESAAIGTGFATIISEEIYKVRLSFQRFIIHVNEIEFNRDYRFTIKSTGEISEISNIQMELKGCNKCFPMGNYDSHYLAMKSFMQDGQTRQARRITIIK